MAYKHTRFTAQHVRGWLAEETWSVVGLRLQLCFLLVGALLVLLD